ncbi:MAG: M6 family metalloprotease domain-containing protein [Fibromonadaceae bacterium]|jgi:M6 family metalloprotease-like protein|nr:M6 family metalloprotease domain-containing protein [Fibromonadaceae bacterium]
MEYFIKAKSFFCFVVVFAILLVSPKTLAAPYNGEEFEFTQPDGSTIVVHLFGDELHIEAESPDGYTLIKDEDGWICYAKLSDDGNEYVSTGVRYSGKNTKPPSVKKKLRINDNSIREKQRKKKEALGNGENMPRVKIKGSKEKSAAQPAPAEDDFQQAPQAAPVANDTTYGLVLIIQYPDNNKKTSLTKTQVDQSFNDPNTSSSMFSWYKDVSNGKVLYKNIFSAVVTVDKSFDYYDDDSDYKRVPELITSALNKLREELGKNPSLSAEFDKITTYTRNSRKTALALNIAHAHSPKTWAKGTWSHRGWYSGGQAVNGVYFYDYQLSNLSGNNYNTIPVGTMLHENGHMLMGWSDLYNYDATIKNFVGSYDIMSSGQAMPNPYFRNQAGWIDTIVITDMNATLSHTANSHKAYVYRRSATELYYIEARRKEGRSSGIPGDGLLIWHVNTQGDNTTLKSNRPYPQVALVQANNASWQQITAGGGTTANTPFVAARPNFSKNTSPAAKYWDNTMSDIIISEVSAAPTASNPTMTFKIGTGGTVSSSSVVPSSSSISLSSSSDVPSSSSSRPSSSSVASSSSGTTLVMLSQIAFSNAAIATKNAINLQVQNSARLNVYNLSGKLEKTLNLKSGIYNIELGDLPKGMYIASISFGKEKKIISVPCF